MICDDVAVFDAAASAMHPSDDHHFVALHGRHLTGWYGPVPQQLADRAVRLAARLRGHHLTSETLPALLAAIAPADTDRAARAALGVVDAAIWDLLGRAAGVPVADLLADRPVRAVPAYASWLSLDAAHPRNHNAVADLAAENWTHTKWSLRAAGQPNPVELGERLAAITAAAGTTIAVDAVGTWDHATVEHLQAASPGDLAWLEDPLPAGHAPITTGVPVALGEHATHPAGLLDLARRHRPAALTPDVLWLGGIEATRSALHTLGPAAPPIWLHGRAIAPALHLAAAHPDLIHGVEYQHHWWPRRMALFAEPIAVEPGQLTVPDRPGLGPTPKGAPTP